MKGKLVLKDGTAIDCFLDLEKQLLLVKQEKLKLSQLGKGVYGYFIGPNHFVTHYFPWLPFTISKISREIAFKPSIDGKIEDYTLNQREPKNESR